MLFKTWITYLLVSGLTGNPLLGVLVAAVVAWGAEGWLRGRFWSPAPLFRRWGRIRRLREDLAINPHDSTARAQLGGLLVDSRPNEARALLQEVHDRFPELALATFHLGAARLNLGDTDGGRQAIELALLVRADLGYGEPMIRLGDHLAGRKRYSDAIPCYEAALRVNQSSCEARVKLGWARRASGDRDGALAAFREALEVSRGAPAFKRRVDRPWTIRAWWASTFSR